jgi:hypothetical protein
MEKGWEVRLKMMVRLRTGLDLRWDGNEDSLWLGLTLAIIPGVSRHLSDSDPISISLGRGAG